MSFRVRLWFLLLVLCSLTGSGCRTIENEKTPPWSILAPGLHLLIRDGTSTNLDSGFVSIIEELQNITDDVIFVEVRQYYRDAYQVASAKKCFGYSKNQQRVSLDAGLLRMFQQNLSFSGVGYQELKPGEKIIYEHSVEILEAGIYRFRTEWKLIVKLAEHGDMHRYKVVSNYLDVEKQRKALGAGLKIQQTKKEASESTNHLAVRQTGDE